MSLDDRSERISHDGPRPIYDQVAADIAADITSGALPPGARLHRLSSWAGHSPAKS